MLAVNFEDLASGSTSFEDDLRAAAGFSPITREDLTNAYARYKDVGVKMGRVRGKSDAALYKQATNDVINWWKFQKNAEAEAERKAKQQAKERERAAEQARQAASRQAAAQEQARQAARASAGSGGSSGSGGPMLPDTAMLDSNTPTPTPPVSITYVQQMLARNGFAGAHPPSYAYRSKADFDAWLRRAIRYRNQQHMSAVRAPVGSISRPRSQTGTTRTAYKPIASNRAPVIR